MDKIAFIIGETFLYWSSIILTLAAAGSVCIFLALYLRKAGFIPGAFLAPPLSILLSLLLGRLVHWYCRWESYQGFLAAMTDYSSGSYALLGVFAGCILAGCLLRLVRISPGLADMLDCMSIAGAAGIALGRLASFFSPSCRGMLVESVRGLPLVYPVVNAVSGAEEYRLATFLIQAMIAALLFAGLTFLYMASNAKGTWRSGDAFLIFLLVYSASQVVMDSTRYDSMFFRSNGFVSVVQVASAVALAGVLVVFSIRWVKARGFRGWYIGIWILMLGLMGCAGYMEYHVQRHPSEALFAYSIMSGSLILLICIALAVWRSGSRIPQNQL